MSNADRGIIKIDFDNMSCCYQKEYIEGTDKYILHIYEYPSLIEMRTGTALYNDLFDRISTAEFLAGNGTAVF